MAECRALEAWAEALPVTRQVVANADQIRRHMTFLAATLPTQGHAEETGQLRFAVYTSILAGWSNEALAYMARECCKRLRWFPVPVQMLEILTEYRPPVTERETVLQLCARFRGGEMERWLDNLREDQPIGDVPESWKRIAVEQGPLRRLADGSHVSRALYHGPSPNCARTGP